MNGSRRFRLLIVLALIIVALVGYGIYWWALVRGTVSTDDAYVDARIVSISSRLLGRVKVVNFKEGDRVQKGDVLVQLGAKLLEQAVDHERAEVERALATISRIKGPRQEEIDVLKAEMRVRKVEAETKLSDLKRAQKLASANAISQAELDQYRNVVNVARAALEVSRKNLILLLAGGSKDHMDQARAELAMARARQDQAETNLADALLYSPIDGIVARRTVDPGEVVDAGQGLLQLVEADKTWIVANLEEQDVAELREGQWVDIDLDAFPGRTLKGRINAMYGATLSRFSLLSTSSASGNFIKVTQRVPVRIDWAEPLDIPVVPGLNAVVRIHLQDSDPLQSETIPLAPE